LEEIRVLSLEKIPIHIPPWAAAQGCS